MAVGIQGVGVKEAEENKENEEEEAMGPRLHGDASIVDDDVDIARFHTTTGGRGSGFSGRKTAYEDSLWTIISTT